MNNSKQRRLEIAITNKHFHSIVSNCNYIVIDAKRWFQKSYGNTYHSCRVTAVSGTGHDYKEIEIGYNSFQYGYGDHYLNTASKLLNTTETILRDYLRDKREKFAIHCSDVERKKDL